MHKVTASRMSTKDKKFSMKLLICVQTNFVSYIWQVLVHNSVILVAFQPQYIIETSGIQVSGNIARDGF